MSDDKSMVRVVSPVGIFVRGNILEPDSKAGKTGKAALYADDKFKSTIMFDDDEALKEIKREAIGVFKAKLPSASKDAIKTMLATLFKDGDAMADKAAKRAERTGEAKSKKEWARGYVIINSSSKYAPEAIDRFEKPVEDKRRFYPGVRAAVELTLKAHTGNELDPEEKDYIAPGVTAYLNNIILIDEKAPRLEGVGTGGRSARDAFKNLTGGTSTEDLDEDDLV